MTAPSKLDDARLREAKDAVLRHADSSMCSEGLAKQIYILIDALSAERERGDRAAGLLRELFDNGPCDVMIGGNPITVDALQDQINNLLATQKAEGA